MATDRLGIHLLEHMDVRSDRSNFMHSSSTSFALHDSADSPDFVQYHAVNREAGRSAVLWRGKTLEDDVPSEVSGIRFFSAHPQNEAGHEILQSQASSTPLSNEIWHLDEQHIPETLYQALDIVPEGSMEESRNWMSWALSCRKHMPEEGIFLKSQRDVFLTAREESCPCSRFHWGRLWKQNEPEWVEEAWKALEGKYWRVIAEGQKEAPLQSTGSLRHLGSLAASSLKGKWAGRKVLLTIRHGDWIVGEFHPDEVFHFAGWSTIRTLTLHDVTLPSAVVFINLVAASSAGGGLRSLTLSRVKFKDPSIPGHLRRRMCSQNTRTLMGHRFGLTLCDLDALSCAVFAQVLLAAKVHNDPWMPWLRLAWGSSGLGGAVSSSPLELQEILQEAGPALRRFSLTAIGDIPHHFSLLRNTNRLVDISLNIWLDRRHFNCSWLAETLENLSQAPEKLSICFVINIHIKEGHIAPRSERCNGYIPSISRFLIEQLEKENYLRDLNEGTCCASYPSSRNDIPQYLYRHLKVEAGFTSIGVLTDLRMAMQLAFLPTLRAILLSQIFMNHVWSAFGDGIDGNSHSVKEQLIPANARGHA
ncbi:predicted protein [Postia placenta Mad-698-R]|nr:predicted protein [Postia placenta Mad-698-R]